MNFGVIAVLGAVVTAQSPDSQFLASATTHLIAHPVETLLQDRVTPRIGGHALLTLPSDSARFLFLGLTPKYRQTPTVVVYRRMPSGTVDRLYEGLAPGRPVPVSGAYVDPHTIGNAIDMTFEGIDDSARVSRVAGLARAQGMHIVRYPQFLHADLRTEAAGFVDMIGAVADATAQTCEGFEFPPVEGMAAGHLAGATSTAYLVALTPADIVIYRITGVTSDGRLVKQMWLRPRPSSLRGLALAADGAIQALRSNGEVTAIEAPR